MSNPFYEDYKNEFQVPNFRTIKIDHYLPAFDEGIEAHNKEIKKISNSDEKPSFENTIAELERSGKLLTKVTIVFYNLLSTDTNDDLDKLSEKIGPKLSAHRDSLFLNQEIFQRMVFHRYLKFFLFPYYELQYLHRKLANNGLFLLS
jgi:peptidyl-dipeptidase Dcp